MLRGTILVFTFGRLIAHKQRVRADGSARVARSGLAREHDAQTTNLSLSIIQQ